MVFSGEYFDSQGILKSTLVGKQEESIIRESLANLEKISESQESLPIEFSEIKVNKNNKLDPRSHG